MTVVTRFAPSPTGYLHVGSARTALFSWLYAKKMGGRFILRIEDTDQERSTPASVQAILDGMEWLGLSFDEGPFYQSKRMDRYREICERLLAEGHAYLCDCSKERLAAMRAEQMAAKQKPRYDGHCRDRHLKGEGCVVRFRNPLQGSVAFEDLVHGPVVFQNAELDDLVLARTDGVPTYNLTVVVDDWDMGVTHAIRGNDHVNNTPRQINILRALGVEPPVYVHVPMILGPDGKRLSKRHGAVSVMQYREEGILPEALLNYLVRLGWSHGDQEIFSIEQMIRYFDIEHLNKAAAAFNPEKLLWLNQHYIRQPETASLNTELAWHMARAGLDQTQGPSLRDLLKAQGERCKTLKEMVEKSWYFYGETVAVPEAMMQKYLTQNARDSLKALNERLLLLPEWDTESLHKAVAETSESLGMKFGKLAEPLRVAVTGGPVSPPVDQTLVMLGRERTLARIKPILP